MPDLHTSRLSARLTIMFLAVIWAASLVAGMYPGAMSYDSIYVLEQARTGEFSDAHPVLMALIWRPLDSIWPGPMPLMLLNIVLYCGGSALAFTCLASRFGWASVIAFILFAAQPAAAAILGVIWIDVLMASLFCAAIGCICAAFFASDRRRTITWGVASLLFIAVAVGSRHNAAAAALPLVALSLFAMSDYKRIGLARGALLLLLAGVLTASFFLTWNRINSALVDSPRNLWTLLAMYDVAGIAAHEEEELPEAGILSPVVQHDIDVLYTPRSVIPMQTGRQVHEPPETQMQAEPLPQRKFLDADLRSDLRDAWVSAILGNTGSYLLHRWQVFSSLIGLPPWSELWAPVYTAVVENSLGIEPRLESAETPLMAAIRGIERTTVLFKPYLYMGIALVLFPFTAGAAILFRKPVVIISAFLFLSGVAHMVGLFFIVLSADYRYSHWLIVSTTLGCVLLAVAATDSLISRLHGPGAKLNSPSGIKGHSQQIRYS